MVIPIEKGPVVGIDFGTSCSCVGVWRKGKVEILKIGLGDATKFPNFVSFTSRGTLVGQEAKDQVSTNSQFTIYEPSRLLGKLYNDPEIQHDLTRWPFKVVEKDGRPVYEIDYFGDTAYYSPEDIIEILLRKIKEKSEKVLKELTMGTFCKPPIIRYAVLTVPSYFNSTQEELLKKIANTVGLQVFKIIKSPHAATLAYLTKTEKSPEIIPATIMDDFESHKNFFVVFDMGGCTLNVSLLQLEGDKLEILKTSGDYHHGGDDFDMKLVDYFVDEFKWKYRRYLRSDSEAMIRLRRACEEVKIKLSDEKESKIELFDLFASIDFYSKISRGRFEEISRELFKSILEPLKEVLKGVEMSDITAVILVGNSCKIPKVESSLRKKFHDKIWTSIDSGEIAAYGATVEAHKTRFMILNS